MSMRRLHLAAIALLALGLLAPSAGARESKRPAPGTGVEMPILVAPMIVDDRLHAYAYISSTIVASSPADAVAIRLKTPFIRDAFVRDVNGKPIVSPDQPDKLDRDALRARLLADTRRVVGDEAVADILFTQVQISPMAPTGQ